jgi:RNA polymerase sigma-70 factor, ECF subfamily
MLSDTAVAADEQLMLDVQAERPGAFERLFQTWREPVWRFYRRRVTDPGRAEELAQDVFTALLEAAPRYQVRGAFRSYLFGIAYNFLLADRRKRRTPEPLGDDSPSRGVDPDAAIWVRRALAALDAGDREILMLREYEGLSYEEIAAVAEVPINTVRSRLFRARLALRDALVPAAHEEKEK